MRDLFWPSQLVPAETTIRPVANVGQFTSPLTRATRTVDRSGHHLRAVVTLAPEQANKAIVASFLADLHGGDRRLYMHDHSYVRRGSFPTGELLTNNTFSDGTTGWGSGGEATLTVADRVARSTRNAITSGTAAIATIGSADPYVQYAPYCGRAMIMKGRGSYPNGFSINWGSASGAVDYLNGASQVAFGLLSQVFVPAVTSAFFTVRDISASPLLAGDYISIPYLSVSRCALVDNGPNLLLRSDELNDGYWVRAGLTTVGTGASDPQGNTTAEFLQENSSTSEHCIGSGAITVSSSAADYAYSCCLKKDQRNFGWLELSDGTTAMRSYFDLNTGVVGSTAVGAGWSNVRTFIASLGNGWFYCSIVGRKTGSATTLGAYIGAATANGTSNYLGTSVSALYAWRPTLAQSSVPTRPAQTVNVATFGSSQTGGALYLKGLPASTNGLLLAGDQFEVITSRGSELKIVTAPLNSDAAGLGYLQFTPPLRGTVADNAPIIVHQPMGRWMPANPQTGWRNRPGRIAEGEPIELVEDIGQA